MTDFPDDNKPRIRSRADYDDWLNSKEKTKENTDKTPQSPSSWLDRVTQEKVNDGIER